MENTEKGHNNNIIRPNHETNKVNAHNATPDFTLPYEDPAITNPEELASFPKPAHKVGEQELENESENRLVNYQKSAVREGRNIIRTDNNPNTDGFM